MRSFNKYLFSTYYVSGSVLGTRDMSLNRTGEVSFMELPF